eukprot:TRINITY_DN2908_c1_g1_i1.p1 TRINITY_DN2908_c1_g1~~TRINITY_DN2908_c1_g1_i1.p1  ORF type:complete len:198 (+),score=19.40 TRINITY_DN2908_c1_g1_i1:20-613(+)
MAQASEMTCPAKSLRKYEEAIRKQGMATPICQENKGYQLLLKLSGPDSVNCNQQPSSLPIKRQRQGLGEIEKPKRRRLSPGLDLLWHPTKLDPYDEWGRTRRFSFGTWHFRETPYQELQYYVHQRTTAADPGLGPLGQLATIEVQHPVTQLWAAVVQLPWTQENYTSAWCTNKAEARHNAALDLLDAWRVRTPWAAA